MYYFRMYVMADKYDVASMRRRSLEFWEEGALFDELLYDEDQEGRTLDIDSIAVLLRDIDALTHDNICGNWLCRSWQNTLQLCFPMRLSRSCFATFQS